MIKAHPQAEEYTALSDRMSYLLLLRLGMAIVVLAWAAIRPEVLGTSLAELIGITTGYLAMACLAEWARRRLGRFGLPLLSAMLLIDGLYLAYAMYMTGATQSPIRFLIYLHLVAVSLLASYRTGLKIALWHSLLLFVVLYAQAAQLLATGGRHPGTRDRVRPHAGPQRHLVLAVRAGDLDLLGHERARAAPAPR